MFLTVGGVGKTISAWRRATEGTVLAELLPRSPLSVGLALGLIVVAEFLVGVLVLGGKLLPQSAVAASVLLAGATAFALVGLQRTPHADCGCLGELARGRVTHTTVVRAALLASMAGFGALSARSWLILGEHPELIGFIAVEGIALFVLSPDLRWARGWLRPHCGVWRYVPIAWSVARLRRTEVWRTAQPYLLTGRPQEHWRDGCWRFVCFAALYRGRSATAVFPLLAGPGDQVGQVTLVDESQQRILARLSPSLTPGDKSAEEPEIEIVA